MTKQQRVIEIVTQLLAIDEERRALRGELSTLVPDEPLLTRAPEPGETIKARLLSVIRRAGPEVEFGFKTLADLLGIENVETVRITLVRLANDRLIEKVRPGVFKNLLVLPDDARRRRSYRRRVKSR